MGPNLYLIGWPANVGGASTKIQHLIPLLSTHYALMVIANNKGQLKDRDTTKWMESLGVKYGMLRDIPNPAEGIALGICQADFFTGGVAKLLKQRGLKVIWSNEMMWAFKGEADAVKEGLIDKVHYVSEIERHALQPTHGNLPWSMPGNYIDYSLFRPKARQNRTFTIGRVSRPDPVKFPENFPVFYETLGIPDCNFRIMAWNDALRRKYRWHRFDTRWEFFGPDKEPTETLLHRLDLFVYPLGHRFVESWGRSTVEAMLTECVPLVGTGHQFHNLIKHEHSGFICQRWEDWQYYAQQLYKHENLRLTLGQQARQWAIDKLCNREQHLAIWKEALTC